MGVAPGGTVWLDSTDGSIEAFSGQAEKIEMNWKLIIGNPHFTREEFIKLEIEESLTSKTLKQNGVRQACGKPAASATTDSRCLPGWSRLNDSSVYVI